MPEVPIPEQWGATIGGGGSVWGQSWSSRMKDEADVLFLDTGSISKISLELNLSQRGNYPAMNFYWNNIGGDGQVYYVLEYSTWSKFETYKIIETTERNYNFIDTFLDKESLVHFFRLKAGYMWKFSPYSNTLTYYSEDYLPYSCCQKNRTYPIFADIFLWADFLIDNFYSPACKSCIKN